MFLSSYDRTKYKAERQSWRCTSTPSICCVQFRFTCISLYSYNCSSNPTYPFLSLDLSLLSCAMIYSVTLISCHPVLAQQCQSFSRGTLVLVHVSVRYRSNFGERWHRNLAVPPATTWHHASKSACDKMTYWKLRPCNDRLSSGYPRNYRRMFRPGNSAGIPRDDRSFVCVA
ncbi:hypothetical protein BDV96DRAFT_125732 [Lophiotrema nucula]|uniref:Uncharacterized protein n=1 Tax=Lophiotrema nucula TaxID=690887 RepID=A0A6A5Z562_9PLEO|nr:hypothetical protein BDV96DRAFT_125732 [Lophiotrema nucula]